jgi:ferrous iron transport protein A
MSTNPPADRTKTLPLCLLAPGVQAEIFRLGGQEAVNHRLRELGFCEAARVKKISGRSTVMCEVCGTKLAISAELARLIHVQPIAAAAALR